MRSWKLKKQYRLKGYDYGSNGIYHVVICTYQRQETLGTVSRGKMELSQYGRIADDCINQIPGHFPYAMVDTYCVMPNHLHLLIMLDHADRPPAPGRNGKFAVPTGPDPKSLSTVIQNLKAAITRNARARGFIEPFWQPRFYDHIIRSDRELDRTRNYIYNNPTMWERDRNNL